MKTVMNVAEAKAKLSELIERAERGEAVFIARKGKEAVRLLAANGPDLVKPSRANLFGKLAHLGPIPEDALLPEPFDAWSSEQALAGFEPAKQLGVAEPSKTFDSKG
ncbi:type II toxin-antitoxin system Phd/YefM family antitoxin [Aquidulcibacter sp.]|uniref:type II toxin-antitoxin system Phd/YefM family antitoxin n=1 Tax=Aquidulcibacter sp. TaxID=2052990 RepID=UPI0025BCCC44|nr:type II toxin-antitoxin system prevent-host-death family antitoxin [Aquidulcibacter sp.]MCA3693052.1 type II toxin-antitoxin system prevent-host-death family antitoxin [Aquidulcibacter sp.]